MSAHRPVCFQVRSVSVHGLSGGGVLLLKQDRMASWQTVEIHGRMVSSSSLYCYFSCGII